ncbi:50S ribosomal protein L4 [Oceanispirochaeta sp.]|jgi:large subunit ribosomal protein L4|uniref:50S ribosomal protein L4 n=1 Tax=Oceanispirochaeta sp. TaxID=2035350 RepID=UPI002610DEAD|nr:50S ribosomal protein L4 [Oceanispirochaeta sp.]MDA3958459.1 50S ribosomal protein L4 [Oceanispirochaeta sp.]
MDRKVFSIDGKELRTITLEDSVFAREISDGSIYNAIKNELANKRVGTASTLTRSEVRGTTAKPWRQKGTGRARAGRRRSPVWVGGSVVFGPKPRDYSYSLPKKVKQLAMKSILTLKAQDENTFRIVEDFTVDTGKTKDFKAILKALVNDDKTVVVLKDDDKLIRQAGRNLPNVRFLSYNRLSAHTLFYGKNVLMLEGAVSKLNEFYGV